MAEKCLCVIRISLHGIHNFGVVMFTGSPDDCLDADVLDLCVTVGKRALTVQDIW